MFKKFAAEALGISDIGTIVPPGEYDKVDADDYLFHEDGEKIFFLIKSKKDEYCFTNLALIHVDGESAMSSKRRIKRYDYAHHAIGSVTLETAGNIDLDVELKFVLDGGQAFSIDVRRNHIEQLKDIYKALFAIGRHQQVEQLARENARLCLQAVSTMYRMNTPGEGASVVGQYTDLLESFNTTTLTKHTTRDYSAWFEKYIHG